MAGQWTAGATRRGSREFDPAKVDFFHQWGKDVRYSARLVGVNKLIKELGQLHGLVRGQDIVDVLKRAGMMQRTAVRNNITRQGLVKDGILRDSIFMDARKPFWNEAGPSVLVGINYKMAPHWHFFELGTKYMGARPFFRPGIQATKQTASKVVQAGVRQIIDKAVRSMPRAA